MNNNIFATIRHWKDFERLSADLLETEGYKILSEPSIDRMGIDLIATKEYRSHDGDSIQIKWFVQCKHYAISGNSLGRTETAEILNLYQAGRNPGDGLLLIVDTDYTEEAKTIVDKFISSHPDARIDLWNQRQIRARLERHPHLMARYYLNNKRIDYLSLFSDLKKAKSMSVLVISDQSALAHQLTSVFRSLAFKVTFLPFWNYQNPARLSLLVSGFPQKFDFVVVFLGDSFGHPIPDDLLFIVKEQYNNGASILFFPFVAWSMRRGAYSILEKIVPVKLIDPSLGEHLLSRRITGEFQKGDFRWMLVSDSFAEDHYVELDPQDGNAQFTNGIEDHFGISHSFEYLQLANAANCTWADTTGNPIIVVQDKGPGKVCYLNTCCHSCMTIVPVISPVETCLPFTMMLRNVLCWLIK